MTDNRILITGSREWTDRDVIAYALGAIAQKYSRGRIVVVHGGARGADTIAGEVAAKMGIAVEVHPVTSEEWAAQPKRAGMIRNKRMVDLGAVQCVAFIINESPGATACAAMAERAGIPTKVFRR